MSERDRLAWEADGRPWRLMRPAARLRDRLRAHGYVVYDLGDERHLEHEPPEDHTPYSETGWPGDARYGVVYAEDIMPPKPGQVSRLDGLPLPSLQQLGAQILADRKAGVGGIRWLKYMNWEPEQDWDGPCYQESWKPDYVRRSSSDRGHIHCSGCTGYEDSTIGDGYDPVARIRGDDMPGYGFSSEQAARDAAWRIGALRQEHQRQDATLAEIKATGLATLAAVRGDDDSEVVAAIGQLGVEVIAEQRRQAERLAAELAPALVDELRTQLGDIPAEQIAAAVESGLQRVAARIAAPAGQG